MPYPSSLCSENEMEELSAKKARKLKKKKKQKRKVRFELVEKKKNKRNKKKKEKTVVHISTDSNDDEGPGVYEHYNCNDHPRLGPVLERLRRRRHPTGVSGFLLLIPGWLFLFFILLILIVILYAFKSST